MRKLWERFEYEILTLLSIAVAVGSFAIYKEYRYNQTLEGISFIGMALGIVGFAMFFKKLYAEKIGKLIAYGLKAFADLVKRLFVKVADKLGIRFKRRNTLFQGTDCVEYFYGKNLFRRDEKQKKYKMPKWKDLKDNNSRVRFIYISFLFKRIKKGWSFKAYETPNGIAAETVRKPEEGKIFECYNIVRYSKDYSVITDEVVAKIYETEENA